MLFRSPENQEADPKDEYCEELLQIYETKLNEVNRQSMALAVAKLSLEKQISYLKEIRDNPDQHRYITEHQQQLKENKQ